jgi:hypothetical protein
MSRPQSERLKGIDFLGRAVFMTAEQAQRLHVE